MANIPTNAKIKLLKKSRSYLIKRIKKGSNLRRELCMVHGRLEYYEELHKNEKKMK